MIKRVVIARCRDYNNYDEAKTYIDFCLSNIRKENKIKIGYAKEFSKPIKVKMV